MRSIKLLEMILVFILLHMSTIQVEGNLWVRPKLDMGRLPLPSPAMVTEKKTSSEIGCAVAASQDKFPFYCHRGDRCLLVEQLDEVLTQREGTPMEDLDVNWKCKINQGE